MIDAVLVVFVEEQGLVNEEAVMPGAPPPRACDLDESIRTARQAPKFASCPVRGERTRAASPTCCEDLPAPGQRVPDDAVDAFVHHLPAAAREAMPAYVVRNFQLPQVVSGEDAVMSLRDLIHECVEVVSHAQ